MKQALIIVDVQNDFTKGGALCVPGGETIIPKINALQPTFEYVFATQDWHPKGHSSFASSHAHAKPFDSIHWKGMDQTLWPDHCIQGSNGAAFHSLLNMDCVQTIFRKGMDPDIDSYSGFYDNGHRKETGLCGFLKGLDIGHLFFCGLAADFCVYFSIKDAVAEGFECSLLTNATMPISESNMMDQRRELQSLGVHLV